MPLPPPAPRKLLHTRTIVCEGYQRADGQWDVDGRLTDIKAEPLTSGFDRPDGIPAGEPVHDMLLRITVNDGLTITDSVAAMDYHPWRICPAVTASFSKLIGLSLKAGFTKKVRELFGGINGCTHLTSLTGPAATTALQTMIRARLKKLEEARAGNALRKPPPVLNTCHTWARTSPVVKRELPEFYLDPAAAEASKP